jgi:uncharacterized membrane protein
MKTKKTFNLLLIFTVFGFVLPQMTLAIGQMTQPIVIKDVLRGQEIQETLILYNSEAKDIVYGLSASGAIETWVTFFKVDNLTNPITKIKIPAQSRINAIAKFKVPNDIPNGTYTGQVAITTTPEQQTNKEGLSVSVGSMIGREVSITVTDKEIINFQATIIPLKYEMDGGEPLKIKVIYDNQGNVAIKPDIQLKITQISTEKVIQNVIYPFPEGEEAVRAFQTKEFPNLIEWPTAGQENGKYKAEIKVLLNGKVMKEENFRFDIGSDNKTLSSAGIANFIGRNLTLVWFVVGGLLLLMAGVLTYFFKKPQALKVGINKIKIFFKK